MASIVHKNGLDKEMTVQYINTIDSTETYFFFLQMPNKETMDCDTTSDGRSIIKKASNDSKFSAWKVYVFAGTVTGQWTN